MKGILEVLSLNRKNIVKICLYFNLTHIIFVAYILGSILFFSQKKVVIYFLCHVKEFNLLICYKLFFFVVFKQFIRIYKQLKFFIYAYFKKKLC